MAEADYRSAGADKRVSGGDLRLRATWVKLGMDWYNFVFSSIDTNGLAGVTTADLGTMPPGIMRPIFSIPLTTMLSYLHMAIMIPIHCGMLNKLKTSERM